jgi:hypothetical protein
MSHSFSPYVKILLMETACRPAILSKQAENSLCFHQRQKTEMLIVRRAYTQKLFRIAERTG